MSEHVTIDDSLPTCIGVHYEARLSDATRHFEGAGFKGVQDITVLTSNLDCNEARRRALSAAENGEGKCFWQGDWDYSAGRCALYKFDYTSYDGPKIHGDTAAARLHADWSET